MSKDETRSNPITKEIREKKTPIKNPITPPKFIRQPETKSKNNCKEGKSGLRPRLAGLGLPTGTKNLPMLSSANCGKVVENQMADSRFKFPLQPIMLTKL